MRIKLFFQSNDQIQSLKLVYKQGAGVEINKASYYLTCTSCNLK